MKHSINLIYSEIPYIISYNELRISATLTFNRTKTIQSGENSNLFMNIVGMALVILNLNIFWCKIIPEKKAGALSFVRIWHSPSKLKKWLRINPHNISFFQILQGNIIWLNFWFFYHAAYPRPANYDISSFHPYFPLWKVKMVITHNSAK